MPEDERQKLMAETVDRFSKIKFIPNPGPQSDAYYSKADIMLYEAKASGGNMVMCLSDEDIRRAE